MTARSAVIDAILWTLSVTVLVAIVWGSLIPEPVPPLGLQNKLLHFSAYLLVTFLWLLAAVWSPLRGAGRWPGSTILIVIASIAVGAAVELGQGLIPGREGDLVDALADILGTTTGLMLWARLRGLLTG